MGELDWGYIAPTIIIVVVVLLVVATGLDDGGTGGDGRPMDF